MPAEAATERQARLRPFLRRHTRGLKTGAVLAGVGTVLSLLVTALDLWDRVIGGDDGPRPAATLTVERELTPDVPWGDYIRAHPEAAAQEAYTEPQLMWIGEELRVVGEVADSGGKRAVLTWEVYQPPGTPLELPAWAPRRLEQEVPKDGILDFRPWIAVPDGAGEFYARFSLTVEDADPAPVVTGPTLTIARG